MNEVDQEIAAVCNRILELTHTLGQQELEDLFIELDSTLSQFEEDTGKTVLNFDDSQLQEIKELLREIGQFETDGVPEQVNDDIGSMKDIVDGMSDSE
jgi:hypothetical protein